MGSFNRGGKRPSGGFGRDFGGGGERPFRSERRGEGKSFGGGRDEERRTSFRATCDDCGSSCEVPFKPTGSKPVYCSNCFAKQGGNEGRSSSFGGERPKRYNSERSSSFGGDRPSRNFGDERPARSFGDERRSRPARFEERQMHDVVCSTCGESCQVSFKPTPGKPVYCDNCFSKNANKDITEIQDQLKSLNNKIDMLLKHFSLSIEEPVKDEEKKKVTKKKTVKVALKKEKKAKKTETEETEE